MSLSRITSYGSLSPERGRSPSGERDAPRYRKLSFSPLPESWNPPIVQDSVQPIGAFEVPRVKRICNLSFPCNCWLEGGANGMTQCKSY
jgi:hypothetical protein